MIKHLRKAISADVVQPAKSVSDAFCNDQNIFWADAFIFAQPGLATAFRKVAKRFCDNAKPLCDI